MPNRGINDVEDWAAATNIARASRITSTELKSLIPSSLAVTKRCASSAHNIRRLSSARSCFGRSNRRKNVRVKEHLEKRVHVTTLHLIFLRHGNADDFSVVNIGKIEGIAFADRAENFGDVRYAETLEIIPDRFTDAPQLLRRLVLVTIEEMIPEFIPPWRFMAFGQNFMASPRSFLSSRMLRAFSKVTSPSISYRGVPRQKSGGFWIWVLKKPLSSLLAQTVGRIDDEFRERAEWDAGC